MTETGFKKMDDCCLQGLLSTMYTALKNIGINHYRLKKKM